MFAELHVGAEEPMSVGLLRCPANAQWVAAPLVALYPWWSEVAGPYHSDVDIYDMSDDGTFVTGRYRVHEGPE